MTLNDLNLRKTAILFFDALNGYYHGPDETMRQKLRPIAEKASILMRSARDAGVPIFFAKANHRTDNGTVPLLITDTDGALRPWPDGVPQKVRHLVFAGEKSSEVIPELDPQPGDYYVPKYRWSAFYQTYLELGLRNLGIDTVIISGGSTDVGIAATVFAGRDMDFSFIVVRDACATVRDQRAHDVLMDLVFPRMSRVRTTEEVCLMIRKARGN